MHCVLPRLFLSVFQLSLAFAVGGRKQEMFSTVRLMQGTLAERVTLCVESPSDSICALPALF